MPDFDSAELRAHAVKALQAYDNPDDAANFLRQTLPMDKVGPLLLRRYVQHVSSDERRSAMNAAATPPTPRRTGKMEQARDEWTELLASHVWVPGPGGGRYTKFGDLTAEELGNIAADRIDRAAALTAEADRYSRLAEVVGGGRIRDLDLVTVQSALQG